MVDHGVVLTASLDTPSLTVCYARQHVAGWLLKSVFRKRLPCDQNTDLVIRSCGAKPGPNTDSVTLDRSHPGVVWLKKKMWVNSTPHSKEEKWINCLPWSMLLASWLLQLSIAICRLGQSPCRDLVRHCSLVVVKCFEILTIQVLSTSDSCPSAKGTFGGRTVEMQHRQQKEDPFKQTKVFSDLSGSGTFPIIQGTKEL